MGAGASRKPKVYQVQTGLPSKREVAESPTSNVAELPTPRAEDFRLAPFLQDMGPRPCLNTEGVEQPPRVPSYRQRGVAAESVAVPTRVPRPEGPRPPQAPPAPAPPGAPGRPARPPRPQKQVKTAMPGPPLGGAGRKRRDDRPSAVQLMVQEYWREEEMDTATPSTCDSDGLGAPSVRKMEPLPFLADDESDREG